MAQKDGEAVLERVQVTGLKFDEIYEVKQYIGDDWLLARLWIRGLVAHQFHIIEHNKNVWVPNDQQFIRLAPSPVDDSLELTVEQARAKGMSL